MDYKRYGIVIIPPENIAEQAIEMSRTLQEFDSFFVLDGKILHPHISLYHAPFEQVALESVMRELEKVVAVTKPFSLRQGTYYPDQGVWVGVRYVADKAILDLHTETIAATKEYRAEQDDARYKARWSELSHSQRKNIEDCGWSDAFALYSPHLSFTKLRQPRADVLAHLLQRDFSFLVERIGLYELGKDATCTELVADFRLAG